MSAIRVGDTITVQSGTYRRAPGNARFFQVTVRDDLPITVTRAPDDGFLLARGYLLGGGSGLASIEVPMASVLTRNGERFQEEGAPRLLGVKPEDTDDMAYIGVDHPGIQWLFEDMANFATNSNWCSEYERLASFLGIPGRKWTVSAVSSTGIQVTAEITAMDELAALRVLEGVLR